jgi:SAM-dependent methyltransferase
VAETVTLYDRFRAEYRQHRVPDARIARAIEDVLGSSASVLNVGAGGGSYEPRERRVVAVEPSPGMIRERPARCAPVVRGVAEDLPFRDAAFDACLAILTVHHWEERARGLAELARVARRRIVLFTRDPDADARFWLDAYVHGIRELDRALYPSLGELQSVLGPLQCRVVPVPHDCSDGFLGAYWRRPQRYLDPATRAAISSFWQLPGAERGLERLRADLESGEWQRRHGAVLSRDALDLGYRVVVVERSGARR